MESIIAFLQAHLVVLASLGVALIDFAIEVNPNLKSNSIVSAILSIFKKESGAA
jgi:hypothetical protein